MRKTSFGGLDIPSWTLEHPRENPASAITFRIPTSGNHVQQKDRSWIERGIPGKDLPWVEPEASLQWGFSQDTVEMLQARGNRVFVLAGPFNEHLLKGDSIAVYKGIKSKVEAYLTQHNVSYCMPPALPGGFYCDASHPTREGYAVLAEQLFRSLLDDRLKRRAGSTRKDR